MVYSVHNLIYTGRGRTMKKITTLILILAMAVSLQAVFAVPAAAVGHRDATENWQEEILSDEAAEGGPEEKTNHNYYYRPYEENEQPVESIFVPDEQGIYVVDLLTGFWKFFRPDYAPIYGADSNIFYLGFAQPVEDCIGVGSTVAGSPWNYLALSQKEWAAGVRNHETGAWWLMPGAYDYANEVGDDHFAPAVALFRGTPMTVDAYVVTTAEAPGDEGYDLTYRSGAEFYFKDSAAAIRFAHQVEEYRNTPLPTAGDGVNNGEKDANPGENGYAGSPISVYDYAFSQYGADKREEARALFEVCAERGDPRAQFMLGARYSNVYSYEERKAFVNAAVEQQYAPAIYGLALLLESEKDEKAEEYFTRAAEMLYGTEETDDALTAFAIGQCYQYHDGTFEENLEKAVEWYAKAADLGDPAAAFKIGYMIYHGRVDGTDEEMFNRFVEAMYGGEADAYFYCALMVMNGTASGDFEVLMQEAADRGSVNAQLYTEKHILVIS